MPNTRNEIINKDKGIIFSILVSWMVGIVLVFLGKKYAVDTTLILGTLHLFFGSLLILLFIEKIEKIESDSNNSSEEDEDDSLYLKNEPDTTDESLVSEDEQTREKGLFPNRSKMLSNFIDVAYSFSLLLTSAGFFIVQILLFLRNSSISENIKPPIWVGVFEILLSFIYLMLVHWFFSKSKGNDEYQIYGYMCKSNQIISFLAGTSVILWALGYNQLERIFIYIIALFCIIVILDFLIEAIRRIINTDSNNLKTIKLSILPLIFGNRSSDTSLIDVIEDKIGVSLRSSWTIKFVRRVIPVIVLVMVFAFWGMTCLVEVGPQSEGIVYRFGRIVNEEPLTPGLHTKLPWPIDILETYPVYKTQYFTVGYESGDNEDYLWTSVHGGEEYKLLLGDGNELVSINMTVHYRINDLINYVTNYSNPEEILQAIAYDKMMKLIVTSDLDGLLSKDRALLANTVTDQLQEASDNEKCGIEVMDVAITSIHPPVEVAANYQELVSAEIQKQIIILQAMMQREAAIPSAEQKRDKIISDAMIDSVDRNGEAISEATQTISEMEAFEYSPEAYKTRLQRDALVEFLYSKKFYLIDESIIDGESEIWIDNYEY